MSEPAVTPEIRPQRQWVTLRSGSMDVRGGSGMLDHAAHDLRSLVGRPHACALVCEPGAAPAPVEEFRRDLSDQGFEVRALEMPEGGCDLARVEALDVLLAERDITADDLECALPQCLGAPARRPAPRRSQAGCARI